MVARRDPVTGALEPSGVVARTPSPSFLARHPVWPVLYAVHELAEGTVSAWRLRSDGGLDPLDVRTTGGAAPCHLAVLPGGRYLGVANYGDGSVAVHPLTPDGRVGERSGSHRNEGHGPNPDRQEGPHAHMVAPAPHGDRWYAVDLGTDTITPYVVNPAGRPVAAGPVTRTAPGTGPRHLAWHPDGRRCYVAGELEASVTAYLLAPDGTLHQTGRVPASRAAGHVQPSEIAVDATGRYLYLANRGVGTVSVFALDGVVPVLRAEVPAGGSWPRHFALLGAHLYVADERADVITVFRVDPATGVPEPVGTPLPVASPTCVLG